MISFILECVFHFDEDFAVLLDHGLVLERHGGDHGHVFRTLLVPVFVFHLGLVKPFKQPSDGDERSRKCADRADER